MSNEPQKDDAQTHMAAKVPTKTALRFDKRAFPIKRAKKLRELVERYAKGDIK